jgi:hypothetical protein
VTAFAAAVALTRREVFDALEACAEAERVLLRCGRPVEAAGVAALFELLEDRVVLDPFPGRPARSEDRYSGSATADWTGAAPPGAASAGSNSSDSELTQ